ncbi:prenyltransferase/squalene oxidase repeat-containing protein [Streptomyces sp. NPDC088261]|uniref:prenyltransferase/squalene oxidase repeat-containing protein n=1 Tax=Streptomyces sp. NPDC088261 TaxID=3365851 RepID=UPI0038027073
MTTVRRSAAVLAASAVLCVTLAQTAVAGGDVRAPSPDAPSSTPAPSSANPSTPAPSSPAPASPPAGTSPTTSSTSTPATPAGLTAPRRAALPPGLYGTADPTRDGVWRQSLAMLGQYAAGQRPANSAILWLKGQQCASGAFPTYRADPTAPCDADTVTDPNATAAAVQALSTLGGQRPVMLSALNWLRSVQNPDGGWGHRPGGPSDANSTSLVIGALSATGIRPSSFRSSEDHHAYDALLGLALPCGKGTGRTGGFAYQRGAGTGTEQLVADNDATAAAVLAGVGKRMVVAPVKAGPAPVCRGTSGLTPERAARNGAAYLASALARTGHLDRPPLPGTSDSTPLADPGSTADAVAALASSGYANQAAGALEWLKKNAGPWAAENGPAAYAQLIFAAHTTGTDPRNFGGLNLVKLLNATGPAPTPVPSITAQPVAEIQSGGLGGTGFGILWVIGIGLAAGVAIGYLLSNRGRAGQHQQL